MSPENQWLVQMYFPNDVVLGAMLISRRVQGCSTWWEVPGVCRFGLPLMPMQRIHHGSAPVDCSQGCPETVGFCWDAWWKKTFPNSEISAKIGWWHFWNMLFLMMSISQRILVKEGSCHKLCKHQSLFFLPRHLIEEFITTSRQWES